VQRLKEGVREKIQQAAIREFKENGFEKASMRKIAEKAGVSVGNLYNYFNNKESLFNYIVSPVHKMLTDHIKVRSDFLDVNLMDNIDAFIPLISARYTYREEIFILLEKSKGSKYEDTKKQMEITFQKAMQEFLKKHINGDRTIVDEAFFPSAFARSIISGTCYLIETSENDIDFVKNMIQFLELTVRSTLRQLFAVKDGTINFRRISDEEIYNYFECNFDSRNHNSCP
jgi:AcrR family transcriptional regulator